MWPGSSRSRIRTKLVKSGIQLAQLISLEGVQLAPVRPALVLGDDRFEGREVAPVIDLEVVVYGDIGGVALVRRGKPDVVRRGDADLDREADPLVVIVDPAAQSPQDGCNAVRGTAYSLSLNRTRRGR